MRTRSIVLMSLAIVFCAAGVGTCAARDDAPSSYRKVGFYDLEDRKQGIEGKIQREKRDRGRPVESSRSLEVYRGTLPDDALNEMIKQAREKEEAYDQWLNGQWLRSMKAELRAVEDQIALAKEKAEARYRAAKRTYRLYTGWITFFGTVAGSFSILFVISIRRRGAPRGSSELQ